MEETVLFHDKKAFERETYEERMKAFGFKNIARMELFLWDLELFLQLQRILGGKLVLKGGAAVQFYMPMEVQRTSVDIDMIFCGTKDEIESALAQTEKLLGSDGNQFHFKKYVPKNPKTALPLHTYYVKIPSVLSTKELNADDDCAEQELKLEFLIVPEKWEYTRKTGENIFAVQSVFEYQILPVSYLFADKLTTLGANTIGVQDSRLDEQVKQFYDIVMIIKYCLLDLDVQTVHTVYLKRAKEEWRDRMAETYDEARIIEDVRKQLMRYAAADSGEDKVLKKYIADFHGLYLNSRVEFSPQSVACGASLVKLMYELMISNREWKKVEQALRIEQCLELKNLEGKEKGLITRKLRETLVSEFQSYSAIPANILKSKSLKRIFWAILDVDNLDEIEREVGKVGIR